ncbi:curli production assembly protein CsgE [Aliidiomarina minuta]|uniref:Curli production assembly/transport component CsgE n=1 Tax=Aliidiomarina minuta TaxID=880057 RepID=A0A432WA52_9GAMM|nr:curli production assembly/transport protein CsgE [Aliidiomarina minuta]RUO27033.1 curli production assembly protein CsgE [Aliidiomarina minuta]
MLKKLALIILFLVSPSSYATDIELGGIVIDRTITRFGKDFFFYYTGYWRDIPATDGITVVIHEQVFPQAGTRLWVEMEREVIYETYFGRRQNDVRKTAERAIILSVNKVAEIQAEAMLGSPVNNKL